MPQGTDDRHLGMLLAFAAAVAYSTAGLFTRLIDLDAWTLLFWRGLFAGCFLGGISLLAHRRELRQLRLAFSGPGLVTALMSAISMILFINALKHTTVADVAIIYATVPFITAGLSYLLNRERTARRTLGAGAAALLGVLVMVQGSIGEGRLAGDLLALAMTATTGATMVLARRHTSIPMLPTVTISSFMAALLTSPLVVRALPSSGEIAWLALFGISQLGLGLLFLVYAARLAGAAETALIGTLDAPLAPFWIWLVFGALPTLPTFVGGIIVLAAVGYELAAKRHRQRPSITRPLPASPRVLKDGCLPPRRP